MEKKAIIEKIRTEALKHCELAEWYHRHLLVKMEERERIRHRACFDVMEIVEQNDQAAAVAEIQRQRYVFYNDFKFLQSEGFDRLAEELIFQYHVYGELVVYFEKA